MSADSSKGETGTAGYAGLRYGQRSGRQKFCLQIEWNRGVFRLYTVTIRYGGFSFWQQEDNGFAVNHGKEVQHGIYWTYQGGISGN